MLCGDIAGDGQAEIQTQGAQAVALSSALSCVLVSAGHRPPRGEAGLWLEVCGEGAPRLGEASEGCLLGGALDAFHRATWAQPMRLATRSAGPTVPGDEDGAGQRRSQTVSSPLDT